MLLLNSCIIIICLIIAYRFQYLFRDFTKKERRFLNLLMLFHYTIAIGFHFYIDIYGGDAIHYWNFPKTGDFQEVFQIAARGSASGMIYLLNFVPSNILDLSFFTGNMMYATLGYLGFIYFYRVSRHFLGEFSLDGSHKILGISVIPLIWFMPNLHYWSSGIGKDSIIFFCIAIFLYGLLKLRNRWPLILLSVVLSFLIRPHITLFLFVSLGGGYVLDGKLKVYQKALILLVFIAGFVSIFGYVMDFIQLESLESTVIEEFTSKKAKKLNEAALGSAVDISSYPLPLKIFTFLYRPLFFDINGLLAVAASFENLFIILFTIKWISTGTLSIVRKAPPLIKGMLIYFILGSTAFSLILGNLGIMLRQKNQFIPVFFIIGLYFFYKRKEFKKVVHENSYSHQ